MRKIILILMAALGGVASAQTNVGVPTLKVLHAPASTNAPAAKTPPGPTTIDSDHAVFDLNIHQAVYRGHVRLTKPDVKLTCELLTVDLPTEGGHLNHAVADTNVVIDFTDEKGQKYHVTSAKAVYAYAVVGVETNEVVTFTGSPKVETTQSTITSEPMIWDRVRNKFTFFGPKMISTPSPDGATNGAMPKLF